MITGFSIRNFKNLAQVPKAEGELLPFGPINLFIGPNGCGKSSMLQAIDFLRAFFYSSVEVYLRDRGWDYNDIPNLRETEKVVRWELKAQLDADEQGVGAGEYHYVVTLKPMKRLRVSQELLEWTPPGEETQVLFKRKGGSLELLDRQGRETRSYEVMGLPASVMSQDEELSARTIPEMVHFRKWVEGFRSYLIWDPKVLRNPDRGKHEELGPSGEHLATIIGKMKDNRPRAFERLARRIRRLFPTVTDISVAGRGWGWRGLRLREANGRDAVFNSQQMSDGILRLLAITALLYMDRIPNVITLEEPENGIHPQLVREVVQILRELTQRNPPNNCQVFLTTHSPYILDEFFDHPEEVYCMDRPKPQAGAVVTRLSDNRQVDIARETFQRSLGEAWTTGLIGASAGVRNG